MKQRFDLHVHTNYSDGKSSPEEVVKAAIALGLETIGISDHAYASCDSACMKWEQIPAYQAEIRSLAEKYKDQIRVLCGIEQDYKGTEPVDNYDYVIGSLHYMEICGEIVTVDHGPDHLRAAADKFFDGDIYCLCEEYYRELANVIEVTKGDIIGHFDLITKFNENDVLFDTKHPRYVAAWQAAADALLKTGKPFEINTGAISRGYRVTPYPAPEIREYLKERGATLFLSSDSHSASTLCNEFDKWESLTFGGLERW